MLYLQGLIIALSPRILGALGALVASDLCVGYKSVFFVLGGVTAGTADRNIH